jgi:hypothetical protein
MSKVRVLVGTRKGAFLLSSDGKREKWEVNGPHFAGWEMYHLKGSPADPNRLYASQSSGWSGQVVQRSSDGGATWEVVGNKFAYEGVAGTHQWYDGTPHIPGNSNVSGIWNRRSRIRTRFTPAWKTPRFSARRTAARTGRNSPDCAATAPGPAGSRARAECVCTPSLPIQAILPGFLWPSRRPARFAPTMPARRGSRSIADYIRNTFRSRGLRWDIAFTMWPCTGRARAFSSCRSIGT